MGTSTVSCYSPCMHRVAGGVWDLNSCTFALGLLTPVAQLLSGCVLREELKVLGPTRHLRGSDGARDAI